MTTTQRRTTVSFALKSYPSAGVQLIWHVAERQTECAVFGSREDAVDALERAGLSDAVIAEVRDDGSMSHFKAYLTEDVLNSLSFIAMGVRLV